MSIDSFSINFSSQNPFYMSPTKVVKEAEIINHFLMELRNPLNKTMPPSLPALRSAGYTYNCNYLMSLTWLYACLHPNIG
jgi:hypothetical protein